MHPLAFWNEIVDHRNTLLSRFLEAPPEAFHEPFVPGTWSCECLFRHLLAGMKWMMDDVPGAPPAEYHPLALGARAWPDRRASYDEVKQALDEVTRELRKHVERLGPEEWALQLKREGGRTVESCIYGLLEHEIEHHGMIRWILKRYTGWDDNEMYQGIVP